MKSPFTFKHTAPQSNGEKQPSIFLLHGMGSNEEDLPQLVKDLENTHHIFSLRGPIVSNPGYAFFTIEEAGKPIRDVFDKVVTYIQAFIREAIVEYELDPTNITILDYVIPSQWGAKSKDFLVEQGAKVRFKTYSDGHGVTPENHQDLITFLKEIDK